MSSRHTEISFLEKNLRGPILEEILDPKDYSVDEIMKSYFREILFLARRYTRATVPFPDLVTEGIMGLLDAIDRFDSGKAKGNPRAFHNLAIVRIKSNMFKFFLDNSTAYTVPNYMARAMNLLDQIRNIVESQEYQGNPDTAILNLECEDFEDSTSAGVVRRLRGVKSKLRKLAAGTRRTYEEMVLVVLKVERDIRSHEAVTGSPEQSLEAEVADLEFLSKFLGNLNPAAKGVITKILEGNTLEDVGKDLGFSRERARQIREDAINHLLETPMYKEAIGGS